jgi:hypothetical protein
MKHLGCRRCNVVEHSMGEACSSCRFRVPLLPRAICLSRLCGTLVAFGPAWALVDSVNSFRTGEVRAEARETIEYECRGSSTHPLAEASALTQSDDS